METITDKILEEERTVALVGKLSKLADLVKSIADATHVTALSISEVAIRIPQVYQQLDPELDEFDIKQLREMLQNLIPQYIEKRGEELAEMIRDELYLDPTCDIFTLAVSNTLACSYCDKHMSIRCAMQHACGHIPPDPPEDMREADYAAIVAFGELPWHRAPTWSVDNYRSGLKKSATIIRTCGFDAKTATVDELDRSNPRLQCFRYQPNGIIVVMTWRTAVCVFPIPSWFAGLHRWSSYVKLTSDLPHF
jgi:hypothetical protein